MKGVMNNDLYFLKGTAITGEVSVSNQSQDKVMLWHFRLGHMSKKGSKKGLNELSKHGVLGVEKVDTLRFYEVCPRQVFENQV